MAASSGSFRKGTGADKDPRINGYTAGDGRKRHRFPEGQVANPNLASVRFQPGNIEGGLRRSSKVYAKTIALIPQHYHVQIDPAANALELVKILDETISFARQMQDMISRSANPNNNKATGRYTALVNRCLDTSARIKGQQIQPAAYGKLQEADVLHIKSEWAQVLANSMTKMRHSTDYAREGQKEDGVGGVYYPNIFDINGEVKGWASDGFCHLIAGVRGTIELRAALDAWERRQRRVSDNIIEAHRRKMNR